MRCQWRSEGRLYAEPSDHAREFFDRVVTPSVEAVRQNTGDVGLAFQASTNLHSLKERVFKAGLVPVAAEDKFYEDINARCPALHSIRTLASNAKHYPPKEAPKLDVGVTAMPTVTVCGMDEGFPAMQMHVSARAEDGQKMWPVPVILEAFHWCKREFEANGW